MRFDIKIHKNPIPPEGFQSPPKMSDRRGSSYNPQIHTVYEGKEDVDLYGLKGAMGAQIKTAYRDNRGFISRTIGTGVATQEASLLLFFSTTFDGYEKTREHMEQATIGASDDPEKTNAARAIYAALAAHFNKKGYHAEVSNPYIKISLPDDSTDPLRGLEEIHKEIRAIEKAYHEGKKPLGNIKEPSGQVKINPRLHPQRGDTLAELVEAPRWKERVSHDSDVEKLIDIARSTFPTGETITNVHHAAFERSLREYLSRGRS